MPSVAEERDPPTRGRAAFFDRLWDDAFRDLTAAGQQHPLATADLEMLGRSAAMTGRDAESGLALVDVNSLVWCTGFTSGFEWITLPVFDETGEPVHERGVAQSIPGLYFVGLHFLTAMSSAMVNGVSRDAARIADRVALAARDHAPRGIEDAEREPASSK